MVKAMHCHILFLFISGILHTHENDDVLRIQPTHINHGNFKIEESNEHDDGMLLVAIHNGFQVTW